MTNLAFFKKGLLFFFLIPTQVLGLTFTHPLEEGKLIYAFPENSERVFYEGKELIPQNGKIVFGIPYDANEVSFVLKTETKEEKQKFLVEKRNWTQEKISGFEKRKVLPTEEDKKRILFENRKLKKERQFSKFQNLPLCFLRPVEGRISGEFGTQRILNNIKNSVHTGTDYAVPIDTPIKAIADGLVRVVHPNMFYTGKTILIDHGNGLFSSYSHLNKIKVSYNQKVKKGDIIGLVGTTGRSTGPHLHLTVSWFNIRIDPEQIFLLYPCLEK